MLHAYIQDHVTWFLFQILIKIEDKSEAEISEEARAHYLVECYMI